MKVELQKKKWAATRKVVGWGGRRGKSWCAATLREEVEEGRARVDRDSHWLWWQRGLWSCTGSPSEPSSVRTSLSPPRVTCQQRVNAARSNTDSKWSRDTDLSFIKQQTSFVWLDGLVFLPGIDVLLYWALCFLSLKLTNWLIDWSVAKHKKCENVSFTVQQQIRFHLL